MNIETLHIGMKVRHPQYGVGVVKSLTEQIAEIAFDDAPRTIAPSSTDLQPAEATATLNEVEMPLANLIRDTAHAVVEALGLEQKDVVVEGLAARWQRGTLVMQSADSSLQPKEVPLETFFHKIVMIRNNLRVLEQKVNASDKLSDADKSDVSLPYETNFRECGIAARDHGWWQNCADIDLEKSSSRSRSCFDAEPGW